MDRRSELLRVVRNLRASIVELETLICDPNKTVSPEIMRQAREALRKARTLEADGLLKLSGFRID